MQREIVLDIESTGLDPLNGDRLIEIGCIELYNRIPTGREYHCFINPERDVPEQAQSVHGISTEFLIGKPKFPEIASEFLAFIAEDSLVIHNASFDIGFLNMEFERVGLPAISLNRVVDTLELARRKHPSGPNSLDALCKRYGIDKSNRTKHGAIVDSSLLAEVYVELLGERQAVLSLSSGPAHEGNGRRRGLFHKAKPRPLPLETRLTPEVEAAHRSFIKTLGQDAIWWRYLATEPA